MMKYVAAETMLAKELAEAEAKAIDSLANDPILCRNMGRHAAIRACEKFSWESKFDEMLVHYNESAKSRSGISPHQASES